MHNNINSLFNLWIIYCRGWRSEWTRLCVQFKTCVSMADNYDDDRVQDIGSSPEAANSANARRQDVDQSQ
jgi:hypothetical protein